MLIAKLVHDLSHFFQRFIVRPEMTACIVEPTNTTLIKLYHPGALYYRIFPSYKGWMRGFAAYVVAVVTFTDNQISVRI